MGFAITREERVILYPSYEGIETELSRLGSRRGEWRHMNGAVAVVPRTKPRMVTVALVTAELAKVPPASCRTVQIAVDYILWAGLDFGG